MSSSLLFCLSPGPEDSLEQVSFYVTGKFIFEVYEVPQGSSPGPLLINYADDTQLNICCC